MPENNFSPSGWEGHGRAEQFTSWQQEAEEKAEIFF
jgi:hypothetical protein